MVQTKENIQESSSEMTSSAMTTHPSYAIIKTGGKQYQAVPGKTLAVEKIEGEAGAAIEFTEVLLRKADDKVEIGRPFLKGSVKASIIKQGLGEKVTAFRFKRRKKVRVKRGHRQPHTVVRIVSI
jgi:large subunit ribosomal protein L21